MSIFKYNESNNRLGWLKLLLIIIPIVLVFVIASLYAVNNWYNNNLLSVSVQQSPEVTVVIKQGSSVSDIADQLKEAELIRNTTAFSWYVGRQEANNLQAGTYEMSPSQTVQQIVEKLVTGDVATDLYTIFPGRRLDELELEMVDAGFDKNDVATAMTARYDSPLFNSLPKNASLEGYIFPETYKITSQTSPKNLLNQAFGEFYSRLTPKIMAGIKKQGLNLHEAITLASIIEKESSNVADKAKIAQVFLKRLKSDMVLGSDVTFFYAAAITNQTPSADLDNPYNTRIYSGLPPGPISNFNFSSLEAVANPAQTNYLYFVAGDDGITYFSTTLSEHESQAAKHCIELCKLPQ